MGEEGVYRILITSGPMRGAITPMATEARRGVNNPDFNITEFSNIRNQAGTNGYVLTCKQWIERTNAKGIISTAGRYGGTFAHFDIAMEFASCLSPEFKFFVFKDYQRLKTDENSRLSLGWNRRSSESNLMLAS